MTPRNKQILKGFGIVLVICLFAYSAVNVFRESNERTIERINAKAIENQNIINRKLDSAKIASQVLQNELSYLKGGMDQHDDNLNEFKDSHKKDLNNLLKLQENEKKHVPDNATLSEQLDVLRRAKYEPYQ